MLGAARAFFSRPLLVKKSQSQAAFFDLHQGRAAANSR
jgi:hypothetical protein